MSTVASRMRTQIIDENFEAFQKVLPRVLIAHHGKVALLHDREVQGYFSSSSEAIHEGKRRYPDMMFSISTVEEQQPVSLGWYSHFHG